MVLPPRELLCDIVNITPEGGTSYCRVVTVLSVRPAVLGKVLPLETGGLMIAHVVGVLLLRFAYANRGATPQHRSAEGGRLTISGGSRPIHVRIVPEYLHIRWEIKLPVLSVP